MEIYEKCNALLASPDMSVRNIIRKSGVQLICTTDDPADDLHWHRLIREDSSFGTKVLPAWRPDKAMNVQAADWPEYIGKLASVSGVDICSYDTLIKALKKRMDFFEENG
jgi:glucuronate isomerase